MVDEDKRYEVLEEYVEKVGLKDAFDSIELPEGAEIKISGMGKSTLIQGAGVLFVGFIPVEGFEQK